MCITGIHILVLSRVMLSVQLLIFNLCCSLLVLPTGLPGGFVHSHIVFSSSFMMRSENFSSAGTLEVSILFTLNTFFTSK